MNQDDNRWVQMSVIEMGATLGWIMEAGAVTTAALLPVG
jgi:hypothetical protein